jgi:predicted transcriptional regulator
MREKNSSLKILRALADEAPLTIYAIARKSGVAVSLVHKVVRNPDVGYESQKVVKVNSEGTWRTGLRRVEYILTFRGLVEYFSLLVEEKCVERSEVKNVVERYREFYDYPVFTEQESLEALLGAQVYDLICSTAWILKNRPPSIPIITESISGSFSAIIQNISKGCRPVPIQWEEKILLYAFTLVFFDLVAVASKEEKISPTPNPALYKLISETYEELREALEQRLKEVKEFEDALKKQFSG